MSDPFLPAFRPPYTPPCENTVPVPLTAIICGGGSICDPPECIPVVIDPDYVLPAFVEGQVVDTGIPVLAGTAPIVWSVGSGSLPVGVTLNADGSITGTPTTAGSGSITAQAANCVDSIDTIVLAWTVAECVVPIIEAIGDITGVEGEPFTVTPTLTAGTGVTWTMLVSPANPFYTIDPDTGEVNGNYPATGEDVTVTITATNECGADSEVFGVAEGEPAPEEITLRYGNWTWPDAPAAPPTFTAAMFTDPDANYAEVAALALTDVTGTYSFPVDDGVRQVMWVADSLITGTIDLKVGASPWAITPAPNTPVQALTIDGVPGQVFFTTEQSGGYDVDALP